MSGYLRLLEEIQDLFLAGRGISIRTMLQRRRWIPVVPTAEVEILQEAYMEEPLYVVYTVEGVTRGMTYDCRMDCYVARGGSLFPTAVGRITHGYAVIEDRASWRLVPLDPATLRAIQGRDADEGRAESPGPR
jgi:acyl-CoA thioesterase FadM